MRAKVLVVSFRIHTAQPQLLHVRLRDNLPLLHDSITVTIVQSRERGRFSRNAASCLRLVVYARPIH